MNLENIWVITEGYPAVKINIEKENDLSDLSSLIIPHPALPKFTGPMYFHYTDDGPFIDPQTTIKEVKKEMVKISIRSILVKPVIPITSSLSLQSLTSMSCKSYSSSGRCTTCRHVNRKKNPHKKFRKKVLKRDKCCIATGVLEKDKLTAAHIMPLEKSHLFERKFEYSPLNGDLLRSDLENEYDLHQWYFKEDGSVVVLYNGWPYKGVITKVNLAIGDDAPSPD